MSSPKNKNLIRSLLSFGVIAVLTLTFVFFNEYVNQSGADDRHYERREVAKDFELPVIGKSRYFPTHEKLSLREARRIPVLLHFWASWCQVCREEKPDIDAFWAKHQDEDVLVLGIASFDTIVAMDNSKLLATPSFTVILDEDGAVANNYKVSGLPVSVLVDEEGFIVRTFKGVMQPYDFAAVENYLASRQKVRK